MRLDQALLEVIDNPDKTQQTTAIGTLFWQTLTTVKKPLNSRKGLEKELPKLSIYYGL